MLKFGRNESGGKGAPRLDQCGCKINVRVMLIDFG